jgi:hypothetical protein
MFGAGEVRIVFTATASWPAYVEDAAKYSIFKRR